MNVAITVWEDRISPVFDAARTLLVVEVDQENVLSRRLVPCQPGRIADFVRLLQDEEVEEVICGAISRIPANTLESSNIGLISFVAGPVERVLQSYLAGESIDSYRMPGCCGNGRCGRIDWYRGQQSAVVMTGFPQKKLKKYQ